MQTQVEWPARPVYDIFIDKGRLLPSLKAGDGGRSGATPPCRSLQSTREAMSHGQGCQNVTVANRASCCHFLSSETTQSRGPLLPSKLTLGKTSPVPAHRPKRPTNLSKNNGSSQIPKLPCFACPSLPQGRVLAVALPSRPSLIQWLKVSSPVSEVRQRSL